jgi:hypothetical protein
LTKLERLALRKLLQEARKLLQEAATPALESHSYEPDGKGKLRRVEKRSLQEIERLLDSPDFRLGWSLCLKTMSELLLSISSTSDRNLRYDTRSLKGGDADA